MAHSVALPHPRSGIAPLPDGPLRSFAAWLHRLPQAIKRERSRRQLDALNDHLRRDVGLAPRCSRSGWPEPADPRRFA